MWDERTGRTQFRSRRGYTLWEVLLVLSLLVVITSISFPTISRAYASYSLKQAAATVSEQLTATRLHAIDGGLPYLVSFELDGRYFIVLPDQTDAPVEANEQQPADPKSTPRYFAGELPPKFRFEAVHDSATVQRFGQAQLAGFPDPRDLSLRSWSVPLWIHPDGTAEDSSVDVTGPHGTIRVTIRGLTGAVTSRIIDRELTME